MYLGAKFELVVFILTVDSNDKHLLNSQNHSRHTQKTTQSKRDTAQRKRYRESAAFRSHHSLRRKVFNPLLRTKVDLSRYI